MELSEALARTSINRLTEFHSLADVLEPDIIQSCLEANGVATIRKRKLPMDAMIWAVIGMALFRTESVRQLINKLDIVLLSIGTLIDPPICGVLDPLKTVFFVLKQSDYFLLCAPRPV